MFIKQSHQNWVFLCLPILWGFLSYLVFSLLGPLLPKFPDGVTPKWIWLWILQIILFIPVWKLILKAYYSYDELFLTIRKLKIPLGKVKHYLIVSYIVVVPTIFTYDQWYGKWLVFGGIVSPIFEELFSRYCLKPYFKEKFYKFLLAAILSSLCFSIMHWGYNGLSAFDLSPEAQLQKLWTHFQFGMILCLIYRVTRSIQIVIWLHIFSNVSYLLTKL